MLLGFYFFIVIALPMALGTYVMFHGLTRSKRCPMCADETLRLQSRQHALLSRFLVNSELHLRWCVRCGWRGTARIGRARTGLETVRVAAPRERPDRVDLRSLMVDGAPWRVMIECWAEGGRWLARLVFIAPSGQAWPDERSLEGSSVLEVISQAYRLPERTLTGRLRRSVR